MLEYLETILFVNLFFFVFLVVMSVVFFRKNSRMSGDMNNLMLNMAVMEAVLHERKWYQMRSGHESEGLLLATTETPEPSTRKGSEVKKRRRPGRPPRKVEQKSP